VGGMTRNAQVQEMARKLFGKEPHKGGETRDEVVPWARDPGRILKGEVKGCAVARRHAAPRWGSRPWAGCSRC